MKPNIKQFYAFMFLEQFRFIQRKFVCTHEVVCRRVGTPTKRIRKFRFCFIVATGRWKTFQLWPYKRNIVFYVSTSTSIMWMIQRSKLA